MEFDKKSTDPAESSRSGTNDKEVRRQELVRAIEEGDRMRRAQESQELGAEARDGIEENRLADNESAEKIAINPIEITSEVDSEISGSIEGPVGESVAKSKYNKKKDSLSRFLGTIKKLELISLLPRAKKMSSFIEPYLAEGDKVLDFGCGDGLVGESLARKTGAELTLVDVINANMSQLPSTVYDGHRIPFGDKEFDKSLSAMVLHHTDNHQELIDELKRVTKSEIIITEDVYSNYLELLILKILDSTNKLIDWKMPLNLSFRKDSDWEKFFVENGLELIEKRVIRPRAFRPSRHRLYRLKVDRVK